MATIHEIFSKNLSMILARRGVTRSALAEEMEVSNAIVTEWMKGRKIPRMGKVNRIATFLQCDIDDLIKEDGYKNALSPHFQDTKNIKKIPLLGDVAAGDPINDAEFPGTYTYGPVSASFALRIHGDSMDPTYQNNDLVYCKECDELPHDGAIVVLRMIDGTCCIKHVMRSDAGVVITSDNPEYPPQLITADNEPEIIGIPVGFLRMYKR